ncbi:hypothetical protein GJ697_14890 [Pseudoduganella sp. FT25W]|jgi:hypothetical protein|uniref:Uncharacterized protein n=1 Tax=Duganella alba TaxID=2666081 RepID=A0A6L5QHC0_9BURK|nr:hypothetical protein [Duganella alba]MRX09126.1 hypothetical protein [Duganella alba]MRX15597.1 hypothetical protein [Duganella alba]
MSQSNKPDPRGFKPGANMPQEGYDPKQQGMSESGNHATGHPGNDTPPGNLQHDPKEQSERALRQDNHNRADQRNEQSAAAAATAATHRDKNAGARGDDSTDTNRDRKR